VSRNTPESENGQTAEPMENSGMHDISMGFLVDANSPTIWRSPMVTHGLQSYYSRQTGPSLTT
jgi:ATP-binding protein involved in chromosome partitioning